MKAFSLLVLALVWCAGGPCPGARAADPKTLNGPILVRFDRALDKLPVPAGQQFGIFRAQEPKRLQNITESWRSVELPNGSGKLGAVELKFVVNDGYNGWWFKLAPEKKTVDWRPYADGFLVLRVLGAPPVWKVELKDETATYPVVVRLTEAHRRAITKHGYVDVAIPLKSFELPRLSGLRELVFVFESSQLAKADRDGALVVAQIGVSKSEEFDDDPEAIINDLHHRTFLWAEKHRHPTTGLMLDRAPNRENFKPDPAKPAMSSLAAVGYDLALLPEWVRLGYLTKEGAAARAEKTLRFVVERVEHHKHLLMHFVDWRDGTAWAGSEASVLDHAICAHGAMTASTYFQGDVAKLTDQLLDRIDWKDFVVKDRRTQKELLALGWSKEKGLLTPADVRSSEMLLAYMIATGSKNPIDAKYWYHTTVGRRTVLGFDVLNAHHSLFTAIYGLNFHDLEGRVDREGVSLYKNARAAALFNRAFCRKAGEKEVTYSSDEGGWHGISAGDSPTGYRAPGPVAGDADSVVWPTAALSALPWIPEELKKDLPRWRNSRAWLVACGPYGLSPFRLGKEPWVGSDLVGIDLFSMSASIANYQDRTIWKLWLKHPVAKRAYERLELTPAK